MAEKPFQRLRQFLAELRRRNVYRVAVTYAVVAFVVWQAANLLFPALGFPGWTVDFVIVLTLLGFPIALVVAWAFEVTPEGVRRTPEAEPAEQGAPEAGSSLSTGYKVLVGLGLVAAAVAGGWYLTGGGGDENPEINDRSVAVLPFDNLSGAEESQPFVNGLHDDLLTRLSNISALKVISRTSVLPYRETELSLPAIADSLGATWIVEGGVQQAGDQVQVNAQLIQAEEDAHQWAETYRRELTTENLFAVQSELTKKIARSLEAQLSSSEQARVERQPTESLEAYRLYVQGRTHLDRRTGGGLRQGADYFRRALDRDSTYALAWAGLADARSLLAEYGYAPRDSLLPGALEAAERALELEPDLAEAYASMGLVHYQQQNGPAALRELQRATTLKPSYARAHHWLGLLLGTLGRHEEAGTSLRRAAELDPMSPPIHVALSSWHLYLRADSLERALEEARRVQQLSPGYPVGPLQEGKVLSRLGRQEQAIAVLRRVLEDTEPGLRLRVEVRSRLAIAHRRAGDTARARELLAQVKEEEGSAFEAGLVEAEFGHHDAALSHLSGTRFAYPQPIVLRYDPIFDPLRDAPRFRELIRQANRAWGLNPDGSLPDSVDVSFDSQADD